MLEWELGGSSSPNWVAQKRLKFPRLHYWQLHLTHRRYTLSITIGRMNIVYEFIFPLRRMSPIWNCHWIPIFNKPQLPYQDILSATCLTRKSGNNLKRYTTKNSKSSNFCHKYLNIIQDQHRENIRNTLEP